MSLLWLSLICETSFPADVWEASIFPRRPRLPENLPPVELDGGWAGVWRNGGRRDAGWLFFSLALIA